MAKPSISVPDELLEQFDDTIWEMKTRGELPRDADRSSVVRELMREFISEHEVESEGNRDVQPVAAD